MPVSVGGIFNNVQPLEFRNSSRGNLGPLAQIGDDLGLGAVGRAVGRVGDALGLGAVAESLGLSESSAIFTCDACVSEAHAHTADITDFPVEEGSDFSDHYNNKPVILTVDGVITDDPILWGPLGFVTGGLQTFAATFAGGATRSQQSWDAIISLKESGQPFQVVTGFKLYDNMLFQSLTATRSPRMVKGVQFSAVLKQVRIVDAAIIRQVSAADTGITGGTSIGGNASSVLQGEAAGGARQAAETAQRPSSQLYDLIF